MGIPTKRNDSPNSTESLKYIMRRAFCFGAVTSQVEEGIFARGHLKRSSSLLCTVGEDEGGD